MFDRLSIRTKLIAIVAAPLVVILVLAGMGFNERRSDAAQTRADADRLRVIRATQELQQSLQLESLYSVQFLASEGASGEQDLAAQRKKTDQANSALAKQLESLGGDDAATVSAARSVLDGPMKQLDATLRPQVDSQTTGWPLAEQLYERVEGAIPPITDRLVSAIEDGDLAEGARSAVALGDYTSSQAHMGVLLGGAALSDGFHDPIQMAKVDETEFEGPNAAVNRQEALDKVETEAADARARFDEAVQTAEADARLVSTLAGSDVRSQLRNEASSYLSDAVEVAQQSDPDADITIDANRWFQAVEQQLADLGTLADAEAKSVLDEAAARVSSSDQAARLFQAGALFAVVLALGLAVLGASSIARPVTRLTDAADRVANEQLPRLVETLRNPTETSIEGVRPSLEQLETGGGRELERLSASVNSIQNVAVDVAIEQATMLRKGIGDLFVNLARRNQGLLDRQLEFIDQLEAEEDDPDQLEHLFKLDHMATRMRRNAESLLVLAGAEPSRRRGQPVPLTKVCLAAVGEIEHFARVELLDIDECEIVSKAAADIAHLLSELMENATQFSPPDTRVEVVGHRSQDHGYSVSITDQGIGMSAEQLAEANEMLAHPPIIGLTLARTLGFIVAGRLAARHGIAVRLLSSPTGGVTAIVHLPPTVLVQPTDAVDLTGGPAAGISRGGAAPPFGTRGDAIPAMSGGGLSSQPDIPGLPPLEYTPTTYDEAVPAASSFNDELSRFVAGGDEPGLVSVEAHDRARVDPEAPPPPVVAPAPPPTPVARGPEPLPEGLLEPIARSQPAVRPPASPGADNGSGAIAAPPPSPVVGAPAPPPGNGSHLAPESPEGAHLFRSTPGDLPGRPPADSPDRTELTSAGLVKRVPRRAGGRRAVPGSDGGGRGGATTSTRTPEEVRSMLSRFHSGKQRAGLEPGLDTAGDPSDGRTTTDFKDP